MNDKKFSAFTENFYGLHHPAAFFFSVARVYVHVPAPQAPVAVVGIAAALNGTPAILANKILYCPLKCHLGNLSLWLAARDVIARIQPLIFKNSWVSHTYISKVPCGKECLLFLLATLGFVYVLKNWLVGMPETLDQNFSDLLTFSSECVCI